MALSYREVAEILKIIDASSCDELILELEGTKLVVRRGDGVNGNANAGMAGNLRSMGPTPTSSSTETTEVPASDSPDAKRTTSEQRGDGRIEVRAPMVGTFYRAPSPTEPPFVKVGDDVDVGDPLCLIEVMKLYTTIEAQHAGRITDISPENGALVEYDQLLLVIEPL